MIIGITGSIATGKSTVTNYLIKKGFQVVDSDKIVHQQFEDPNIIKTIIETFGSEVFDKEELNRKKLGKIIFSDEIKRKQLNDILHPKVIDEIKKLPHNQKLIFVDVPLLYEINLEHLFDKVVVVYIPIDLQMKRLTKRDNISEDYAKLKISSQMNIESKKEKADFVINNENSIENTYQQIDNLLRRLNNEI